MVVAATLGLLGCGDASGDPGTAGGGLSGSIRVFAAASLTDAFEELAGRFEADQPGVSVALSFAGSSSLREQILAGAPGDVFASADAPDMDELVEAGLVGPPADFATNRLQIAVPDGNPAGVTALADLARPDLLIGLCAEVVPCGGLAREALGRAGVEASVDTNEADVRAVLSKVAAGELDAGIVYRTDVIAAGADVEGVDIAREAAVTATYPIAPVAESGDRRLATAFVDFVLSDAGRSVLADHGFGAP